MSANPDEKTTIEDELEKEMRTENNIDAKEDLNQSSEIENQDNETRRKLRKNPKKTVLLYSAENLNKFEKKKKLTPTDLKDEDIKLFKNILDKLKINPKSYYFRSSPLKQFETKEDKQIYRSIVAHPMDLSHILKKINNQKYNTYQEFYNDIVLIWDNAQLFNQAGTVFYEDAEYMRNYTEKIFKEKKVDDKIVFKEKQIFEENNYDNEEEANNDESNNNEEENENSNDKKYLGKKRKNNNVINDENENENKNEEEKNIAEEEIGGNPIIDIKNSDNDNIEPKKKQNNKTKEKDNQSRKSPSVKSSPNEEKKLENILENMGEKNNNNKNKIKNKKMSEENNETNNNASDNNKENDTNNNNNSDNNINNNNIYIERYNENLRKKEEDYKWNDELIKNYSYKIAKKLDKLTDEDMFDLIEFIETIKPEAIDDTGNLLNIDMTKFEGETYISVLNFVENAILNNSMYK